MGYKGVSYPEILIKYGFIKTPVEEYLNIQLENRLIRLSLSLDKVVKSLKGVLNES